MAPSAKKQAHAAAKKRNGQTQPTSSSMEAIKADRITQIAFFALMGALLAGVIYFVALVFLI